MKLYRHISHLFCSALLAVGLSSCLDSNESETIVTNVYNAIVTSFSLEANSEVCPNLSIYTFTIDNYGLSDEEIHRRFPDDGIIFNPDSLPVGTIPDSVKVNLSYGAPDSVYFKLYDAEGTIGQYANFANDSALYFASYPDCRLTLVSKGGVRKTYHIKINVHQVKADTVVWRDYTDPLWVGMEITDQRTDTLGDSYCWFVEESGLRDIVSFASKRNVRQWSDKAEVTVAGGDLLDLSTLYNWHGALYAIGRNSHELFTSTDGKNWQSACSVYKFESVLGNQLSTRDGYGKWNKDSLNAVVRIEDAYRFATSADGQNWNIAQQIPDNFPVRGFSRPIGTEARSNYGNLTSRLYITGGLTAKGELVSGTWSCDGWSAADKGPNWEWFEQNEMPAMTGATVLEYTLNAEQPKSFWILQPGTDATGVAPTHTLYGLSHTTLYYSQDHGVSWHRLSRYYKAYADNSYLGALACNSGFCDEEYRMVFFGGTRADGSRNTCVWGGQLNSLTFNPKK